MASPTDAEMAEIAKLQGRLVGNASGKRRLREEGVQQLSGHFSWPEFSGDAVWQSAHQQFVYECAMFAADRGLAWSAVRAVAGMTRDLFPQLADLDPPRVLALISDWLTKCLPRLPPAHHKAVFHFLSDTCVTSQRLLQAVVGGTSHRSINQKHLEVHVPPTPLPLAQGDDECSVSQGDDECVLSQGDDECSVSQGDDECVLSQDDDECSVSQGDDECVLSLRVMMSVFCLSG
ncbi:uncharacterized protein C8orf74 homolog isoform X4 [Oncorhynchus keta]|uniref:uncharacterized protein C8orf74 homolog isoform X4 n=1 Tax=Oncorhynchus keta TaxID=8018 RepID=UPI00227C3A56|nr:uncharacterized protein C8orf74 homolog isoform X4 [Oncorhynchus keta]